MKLKIFSERNFWYWVTAIVLIAKFINDINESGFWKILPAYHVLVTVLITAFFFSIFSYALEDGWLTGKKILKKDLLISGSISAALIITGLVYWKEKYWIAFAGFTFVFYLIFFGYGFITSFFKRKK